MTARTSSEMRAVLLSTSSDQARDGGRGGEPGEHVGEDVARRSVRRSPRPSRHRRRRRRGPEAISNAFGTPRRSSNSAMLSSRSLRSSASARGLRPAAPIAFELREEHALLRGEGALVEPQVRLAQRAHGVPEALARRGGPRRRGCSTRARGPRRAGRAPSAFRAAARTWSSRGCGRPSRPRAGGRAPADARASRGTAPRRAAPPASEPRRAR